MPLTVASPARRMMALPLIGSILLLSAFAGVIISTFRQGESGPGYSVARRPIVPLAAILTADQTPAIAARPLPPTTMGINLSALAYHLNSRAFANLLIGTDWTMAAAGGATQAVPESLLSRQGMPSAIPPGASILFLPVQRSETGAGVVIRCTWNGTAQVGVEGGATAVTLFEHGLSFHRQVDWERPASVRLKIMRISADDPLRNLDCRESDLPRSARFDPRFVTFAKQFRVLRFMDWQAANGNAQVRWDTRALPGELPIRRPGGVAVEDMVELLRETGADGWFTIPWNADDEYICRFAIYVRDHLPPDAHVYVEMANEVWNTGFPVNRQAAAEGIAEGLSVNPDEASLYRYAERAAQGLDIWMQVFATRPNALIRVLATMHWSRGKVDKLLAYKDTPSHFDALATAPYFSPEIVRQPKPKTVDEAFAYLNEAANAAIDRAAQHKASAQSMGLRYIAYEGGQHVVLYKDQPLMMRINRDPRMYDVYRRYLAGWKARIGDTFVHYASVQKTSRGGAFGLAEHPGQPLSEAPKLRAVLEAR